jgi:hypothetical protein
MELMTGEEERPQKVTKEVFVVVERAPLTKPLWVRIGSAWENRDGSLRVILNALPLKGELVIREPRVFDDSRRSAHMPA